MVYLREFRQLVIEMVLATDMSYHFTQIKVIKNIINLNENIDKTKALSLILHTADIGHPSKQWFLHYKWTSLLVDEFFAQVTICFLKQSIPIWLHFVDYKLIG